ncbi:MAG TPA: phosphatidate cytidylyltransferase [Bacilli bacterium]|nr:phosphatidate cytidylyltransferase [Bacilli bacterium]
MKKRVISAIVAYAIVIPLIILGGIYFAIGVTVIALLAYKELAALRHEGKKIPKFIKYLGGGLLAFIILNSYNVETFTMVLNYKILAALILSLFIPVLIYKDSKKYNTDDALYLTGSIILLGIVFSILIYLRNFDLKYLILFIIVTTITDIFAYTFGCLIGRTELLPEISPNKTWEGAIMGSLVGTFVSVSYYLAIINPDASILKISLCILLLTFIGQLGDLVFSSMKRLHNIKDFSNIMPGHGGILDRLDSLILVLLAFMLLINII